MIVQLLHSVLVLTMVLAWLGLANSVMWTSPPDTPFTYHLVAEDGWWMAVFDQSWQHLVLVDQGGRFGGLLRVRRAPTVFLLVEGVVAARLDWLFTPN